MSRRKRFFPKRVLYQIIIAPVVIVLAAITYIFCIHSTVDSLTTFDVVYGDTVAGVANRLEKNGLSDSVEVFKMSVRLQGGKIQRGQYDIPRSASVWRIADMLSDGNVASVSIVIPEGLTIKQIKIKI